MNSETERFTKEAQEADERHAVALLGLEKNDRAAVTPNGLSDRESDSDPSSFLEEDPDANEKANEADDDGDWAARESELQSTIKDEENELQHMAKKFHANALKEEQFSAEFKKAKMDKEAHVESSFMQKGPYDDVVKEA